MKNRKGFPVVGIGASAGGLDAFTKLLSNLPVDTGMAFILLQHLDPNHDSFSRDILARITKMSVTEVKNGMEAKPNCIYIIPPNFSMGIKQGKLQLTVRTEERGQHFVIDSFFSSLAEDQKNRAIGIVLSGTGNDGTQGLMAIKAVGGITIAQDPKSAKFDSMPQAAIGSGNVDLILAPEQIAEELSRISRHSYVESVVVLEPSDALEATQLKGKENLPKIFLLLKKHCHVDFTFYKSNTVQRRIERQMMLHKIKSLSAYADFLVAKPKEINVLCADILIHVTSFFRDPQAFEALKTEVFPKLLKSREPGTPLRIWVPGCSTGEEAYSIAICLFEFLGEKTFSTPIQIFATDLSETAIQKARAGIYAGSISHHVSPERLTRFFMDLEGGEYKIAKSIRDVCLFSRHNVTSDPPFRRIDFISCRNLLIYFTSTLQKHVFPMFHYSLVPNGFLWLGKSEAVGGFSSLFSLEDNTNKIYSRKNVPISMHLNFPASTFVHGKNESLPEPKNFPKSPVDVEKIAELAIQSQYPAVLINEEMTILQLRGRTAPFIEAASGVPSYHLFKMAHPELVRDLRMTILAAKKSGHAVRKMGLSLKEGRTEVTFNLNVIPTQSDLQRNETLYLILFEKTIETKIKGKTAQKKELLSSAAKKKELAGRKDPYVLQLQKELDASQDYQHSLVEKYETAQEDLTTVNEELQSANEELQSTNEELETAKEELQSGNEELTTLNDELQTRSTEQTDTNNDLINLLASVQIPIVMLDNERRVRRFTPTAAKALNLIPSDIGRPLTDLRLNFTTVDVKLSLEDMVSESIDTMELREAQVQDRSGCWFRLQVRPYKTVDNKIDGAVLAFVDINQLKLSLKEVRTARNEAENANHAKDLFLTTLSHELRTPLTAILSWSQLLAAGKLDAQKSQQGAETIERCAKVQAQLIDDLLDISRIAAGKLSLEISEIDPIEVAVAAIEKIRFMAEAKGIQIETVFADKIGTIMADPARLQQVFWNLLTNAVKFSYPDSKIILNFKRIKAANGQKARAEMQISDFGKGIAPEFLPQIFDSFSQEDSSSIRVHGGLGLGLAIVRNLIELQGGIIRVESLGEKLGATFTVVFPIKSDQVKIGLGKTNSVNGNIQLQGIRVLIVDDELDTLKALGELLRTYGAEIQIASSADEALKVFTEFKPDVLVSDIAMPGEDGISLMKKIRAMSPEMGGKTPSLAVTAYAAPDDLKQTKLAGFQAHLSKPVDGHNLVKAIFRLAGN